MLQIVLPHALVLRPVDMFVDTAAICLIVGPVSIVDVTIDMDEPALPVGPVLTPLTGVLGSIVPGLLTEAVAEAALPLPCVHCTGLESVGWPLLALLVRVVHVSGHSLAGLFLSEVLTAAHLLCPHQGDHSARGVAPPERLQLDDILHIRLEQLVIVTFTTSSRTIRAGFEPGSTFISLPA